MKILIDIPKEFEIDYRTDRFADFFGRVEADMDVICGNYERETADILRNAFAESRPYDLDVVMEQLESRTDIDKIIGKKKEYGRWIPVEEYLPPIPESEYIHILHSSEVVAVLSDCGNVFIAKYNFGIERWIGASDHKITHWTPLPETPEKGIK